MTLVYFGAKITKNSYSTKFFTTSSPKVQCSKFILHFSLPTLPFRGLGGLSLFTFHSSFVIRHLSFPSIPHHSLSPYKLKANKFEGMRDFSPQKRCAS